MIDYTIRELKCFIAIYQQGGFRAAARSLGISQGGTSQNLSRLERKLGKTLVIRERGSGASCKLSRAGEALLPRAVLVVALCEGCGVKRLEHLEALVAIGTEGGLRRAAETLYTTGSNLTHKMQALSQDTGGAVLIRNTSKLTTHGADIFGLSLQVLDLCNQIESSLSQRDLVAA